MRGPLDAQSPLGGPHDIAAQTVADLRFSQRVCRLHARGPRLVAELLAEIGAERSITRLIEQRIDRLLSIPDEALDAAGGRDLPPIPVHVVEVGDG